LPDFIKFIVLGIPVLGIIIFVHELGHFIAARMVGVRVHVFSLGFGRRLFGVRRGHTDYRVALLPLGGYVKMAGDNIEEELEGEPYEFLSKSWWQRVIIAVAGPGANFVMAIVCGILMFAFGFQYPLQPNAVGPVDSGSVADSLGLRQGEEIVSIAGEPTANWREVVVTLSEHADEPDAVAVALTSEVGRREIEIPASAIEPLLSTLVPDVPAIIGSLTVGLPAYAEGLQKGDRILAVDGAVIRAWSDLRTNIIDRGGETITLLIEREGRRFERELVPVEQAGEGLIGIRSVSYGTYVRHFGIGESVQLGVTYSLEMCRSFVTGLIGLFGKPAEIGDNLVGPIGLVKMSAEEAGRGRTDLLNWLIFVSIALMVMNLLPIPVLDGGHVLNAVIEAIRGRPLGQRELGIIWRAGAVFLIALMVFVSAKDIFREFHRSRADRQTAPAESVTDAPIESESGE